MLKWLKRRKFNFALILCSLIINSGLFAWIYLRTVPDVRIALAVPLLVTFIASVVALVATLPAFLSKKLSNSMLIMLFLAVGQFAVMGTLVNIAFQVWPSASITGLCALLTLSCGIIWTDESDEPNQQSKNGVRNDAAPEISHESAVRIRVAELEREIEPGLKKLTEERVRLAEIERMKSYRA